MKYLLILFTCVLSFPVQAQDFNLDFENWNGALSFISIEEDITFPQCYNFLLGNGSQPENTGEAIEEVLSGWMVTQSGFGLSRTTDAYSGDFAAVVHILQWSSRTFIFRKMYKSFKLSNLQDSSKFQIIRGIRLL